MGLSSDLWFLLLAPSPHSTPSPVLSLQLRRHLSTCLLAGVPRDREMFAADACRIVGRRQRRGARLQRAGNAEARSKKGMGQSGKPLHFKGSAFHRVIPGFPQRVGCIAAELCDSASRTSFGTTHYQIGNVTDACARPLAGSMEKMCY